MSEKARDGHGRWRNLTIGFRLSPEENAQINALVALSGLTKQEYICNKLRDREVVVMGNPRVYKALKNHMEQLYMEFRRLCDATQISDETLEVLEHMTTVYDRMKEEPQSNRSNKKERKYYEP